MSLRYGVSGRCYSAVRTRFWYVVRVVSKISKYEVGIVRVVLVATQVLWLLRLIDRRLGGACLYHQGVRSTAPPR